MAPTEIFKAERHESVLSKILNTLGTLNERPFDPGTSIAPPDSAVRAWGHYGVMIPNLPEPYNFFNVLSIVGTPGATVFDNDFAVYTTPRDTAYLLSATDSMTPEEFRSYSIHRDCAFTPDGSHIQFTDDLTIKGTYPNWELLRKSKDVTVKLKINSTDVITHFVNLAALNYTHWSLLAQYKGIIQHKGSVTSIEGLCTFEYAKGVSIYSLPFLKKPTKVKVPLVFFTYQIINIDDRTQILLGIALGPNGLLAQKTVYLRSLDQRTIVYKKNVEMEVMEYFSELHAGMDGRQTRIPKRYRWDIQDDYGENLLSIDCEVKGKLFYGVGGGYASWFAYKGKFKNRPIDGKGYIEYIDRR